ncbi:MAG: HAMP domain-containing sensor histidine kinase, partial [Myxococcota bacterium]
LAVAVGCYPVARRVTRRLELTGAAVQQWGAGDLAARAPVLGRDEVAQVAETFNAAAGEVERLFEAQRRVLASASHELRSPLARLRVAVQLAAEDLAPEGWTERAIADIEDLDLHALVVDVVEEDVVVRGAATSLRGDRRLLRRLVRNLVDNARRHGAPPIVVTVRPDGLDVEDGGLGVDPAYEDRIFEPFVRLDHEANGVGLGLHLVREIARSHGGDARYRRGDQGGSCFSVTLR